MGGQAIRTASSTPLANAGGRGGGATPKVKHTQACAKQFNVMLRTQEGGRDLQQSPWTAGAWLVPLPLPARIEYALDGVLEHVPVAGGRVTPAHELDLVVLVRLAEVCDALQDTTDGRLLGPVRT